MVIIIMSNGNKLVYKLLQTSNVVLSTDFFAKILIPGNIGNHLCNLSGLGSPQIA